MILSCGRAARPGAGPDSLAPAGESQAGPGSVTVPGPLACALASEQSRCHAGGDRPGALPSTPGHIQASLDRDSLTLWLKNWQSLSVCEREQSAARQTPRRKRMPAAGPGRSAAVAAALQIIHCAKPAHSG